MPSNYQYSFRGLTIGSGTSYVVEKVDGLLGLPPIRISDTDRSAWHGAVPAPATYGKRLIDVDVKIEGSPGTDIENKIRAFQSAFQLPRLRSWKPTDQFAFRRPDVAADWFCYARVSKVALPSDFKTARGIATAMVQLEAPDPTIYGATLKSDSIYLAAAVTSASKNITNDGDYREGFQPILTIRGPATNPIIQNGADGNRQIKTNLVLGNGQYLVINVDTKEVTIDGVPNFSVITNDSQWWAVLPGSNTITYNRDASNTGVSSTLTIEWRDTRI